MVATRDDGAQTRRRARRPAGPSRGAAAGHCAAVLAELERLRLSVRDGRWGERADSRVAPGAYGAMLTAVNELVIELARKNRDHDWQRTHLARFSRLFQGQRDLLTVATLTISELAPVVPVQQGALYMREGADSLRMIASYARQGSAGDQVVRFGEGLVGQCAVEGRRIVVHDVPPEYFVRTGLGGAAPRALLFVPVVFEGELQAVLELASFTAPGVSQLEFLDQLAESLGVVLASIASYRRTEGLLAKSQSLTRELERRQDELEHMNAELESKAGELLSASTYKSEFLANVSHELRTPLNSLLILSDHLAKNLEGNMTPRQVEFARTVHSSGAELLALINDILDLSKIESGTVTIETGEVLLADLKTYVERSFRHIAEAKRLRFEVELDPTLPPYVITDAKRLQQVIKNLLANAFKFTDRGTVRFSVRPVPKSTGNDWVALAVQDTGVGIPADKQGVVFEAFQQAGSAAAALGGTGLGLAICRQLAMLLGGEIHLESEPGVGSTFTFLLPRTFEAQRRLEAVAVAPPNPVELQPPRRERPAAIEMRNTLLVVTPTPSLAKPIAEAAGGVGLTTLVMERFSEALATARELQPACIAIVGCGEPGAMVDRLKRAPRTEHVPVLVFGACDEAHRLLVQGALAALPLATEPASLGEVLNRALRASERRRRRLLLAADDGAGKELEGLLAGSDLEIILVDTAEAARAALREGEAGLVVTTPELGNSRGVELLADVCDTGRPGVIFAPGDLMPPESHRLVELAARIPVKVASTPEGLLRDSVVHLHRRVSNLSPEQQHMIGEIAQIEAALAGRRLLVVDDDVRNVFAIGSVLERYQVHVVPAETGKQALEVLEREPAVDMVMIDMMLPGIDGVETVRQIRSRPRTARLPVVAVTARAMAEDRARCFAAGATDFIAKPLDADELLGLLSMWLFAAR
jgi:signal transduction histidine kinase/CheY-like chemotaxis protein